MTIAPEANPKFHPLANAFPLMEGDEFADLVRDIDNNGLSDPVVMLDGKILDGRNRWRATQVLGIAHREVKFEDLTTGSDDPVAWVWSKNGIRRHLTPSQRAMAAAALATASAGRPRKGADGEVTTKPMTNEEAAEKTGTSPASVKRAKKVRAKGAPEVVAAVERGDLPVDPAARLADLPVEEQKEIMATTPVAEIPKAVPEKTPRAHRKAADAPVAQPDAAPEPEADDAPELAPAPEPVEPVKGSKRRPATIMREQMVKHYLVAGVIPLEYWTEHQADIGKINKNELASYVKDLKAVRTEITRFLKLIEASADL